MFVMKKMIIFLIVLVMLVSVVMYVEVDILKKIDFLLIGGGIMSVLFGIWLQVLQLDWDLIMVEKLDGVVLEFFNGWNNVGIGYLVNMELNYMLEWVDGLIDVSKVFDINE